jgi:hypothetical protein
METDTDDTRSSDAARGIRTAQSGGGYDLSWWTIDGGGITFATGGTFDLGGTVGQPDASNALTGGAFSLTGGFWFAPACIAHNGDVDANGCIDDADLLRCCLRLATRAAVWVVWTPIAMGL